ncbi:MAG: glycosyltransferase [Acidobacteria bacterium]|nr:glycosyltransferase [Acidobacteriota bacterium]
MIPRVAFMPDCFHEVNGVALTSRQLDAWAQRQRYPFLSIHYGPRLHAETHGDYRRVELDRTWAKVAVDCDLWFDAALFRHRSLLRDELRRFRPDVVHITGPGDAGILGAWLAHDLRIPLVISWHTNVHEFAARRLRNLHVSEPIASFAERKILDAVCRFYKLGKVLLAPSPELLQMLQQRTGRPVYRMTRGCDTTLFRPRTHAPKSNILLGFTGRLTAEKNLRSLASLQRKLDEGYPGLCRFLIVGEGGERPWLEANLRNAVFTGVLKGEALAEAYSAMDIFVFPSETDTYGNVVVEAMASGVPAVVSNKGGPRFLVKHGETGFVADSPDAFTEHVALLARNLPLRRSMGQAARQFAEAQSWDSVFQRVYQAYAEAVTGCPQLSAALPAVI